MILFQTIGRPFESLRDWVAGGVARLGVHPNVLTALGLPVHVAVGALFATGHLLAAALGILAGAACDMLDGAVARVSGKVTKAGAVLDSTIDRYSDAAVFGGVMVWCLRAGNGVAATLAGSALVGAFAVSYIRARAECVIERCKVGFFERPERLACLLVGALFGNLVTALWILGIGVHWTAAGRLTHALRTLRGRGENGGFLYRLFIWDFDRGSLAFDLLASALALACILL